MRNIFLCCGAHNGDIVKQIDSTTQKNIYGNNIKWDEIHLFEPQSVHEHMLSNLQEVDMRVRYHKSAVSIESGIKPLYVKGGDWNGFMSSTLDDKKTSGRLYYTEDVTVINLIDWIRTYTTVDDYVCIDMDIECEEYNILPVLVQSSDILDRIKFISIEFHSGKSTKWAVDQYDIHLERYIREFFGDKFIEHNLYYDNN